MEKIIYSKETEQQCIDLINQEPYNIQYIINPSEELQKLAVKQEAWSIQYIENPSKETKKLAVQQFAIMYLKNR